MKYGGIHYDYGQLTIIFFLILEKLQSAVYQDSIIIQCLNKGQNSKLPYSYILDKGGLNALVCQQRTGISRTPYAKAMSLKRLLKIESNDKGLKDIYETSVSLSNPNSRVHYVYKKDFLLNGRFSFGFKFFFTQYKNSQKSYQLFPKGVNNFKIARYNQPNFLSSFGIKILIRERKFKTSLLICKMVEYIYSHNYRNYVITKRIAPIEINISHEKLAIRACDLFRISTISLLTTKSEYSNSLFETICNNCHKAVACDCINPFTGQCVKVITKKGKEVCQ